MILDYIKYKNWSRRNIVVAACVPIMMIALYNWFATPHLHYLQAAQRYEKTVGEIEKTSKIIGAEIQISQEKLDKVSKQFRQERMEFFGIDEAKSFLWNIQSEVEKNGCFVNTLTFSPAIQIVAKDDNSIDIQQYQVNLSVIGQYEGIVKLLDFLQSRKEKVWVDTIELRLRDNVTKLLACDLSLSVYSLEVKEVYNDVKVEK
jgi:hypothetical protein